MVPLKLYHLPECAPSRCALMVIRVLNLEADVEIVNIFAKEQLRPEFVAINPQHCVPTIDDGGFVLWESRVIASYLANKYDSSKKLYPSEDPKYTAKIDRLLNFDAGTLFLNMKAIAFPALFLGEKKVSKEKRDKLNESFGYLNTYLEGSDWVAGGSDFTIADISILSTISGIVAAGWDLDSFPNVQNWLKNCSAIPGYDESLVGAKSFGNAVKSKLDPGEI